MREDVKAAGANSEANARHTDVPAGKIDESTKLWNDYYDDDEDW